jgi:hypothetical protein
MRRLSARRVTINASSRLHVLGAATPHSVLYPGREPTAPVENLLELNADADAVAHELAQAKT